LGKLEGKRLVVEMHVLGECPERQQNEGGVDDEDGDSADVVDPLAEFEAAEGCGRDCEDEDCDDEERREVIFGEPGGAGADEVGELGGDGVEDGGGNGDAVEPEVPGGHKAPEISEGGAGPDVEATFEGHLAIEVDDGDGHGEIEEEHGGDPGEGLGAAKTSGDADPRAADHAEDLREDEVAETEPAGEGVGAGLVFDRGTGLCTGLWDGRGCGHLLGMVAQCGAAAMGFL
jgi:hypothetical protein